MWKIKNTFKISLLLHPFFSLTSMGEFMQAHCW